MKSFYTKDGRYIEPKPHIARFNGKANYAKSKTLLILNHFSNEYLTARQIHAYTGVNLHYIEQRLTFWYNIRYVNRKPSSNIRPCWAYQITDRGRHFVRDIMPPDIKEKYVNEINEWYGKVSNTIYQ